MATFSTEKVEQSLQTIENRVTSFGNATAKGANSSGLGQTIDEAFKSLAKIVYEEIEAIRKEML